MPAAASKVGNQSMLIVTCSETTPHGIPPFQWITAGMRRPPSSNSVFLPVKGQVSE
jgi:hypothetical protein